MKTDLVAVRLERTREVLRELLHSVRAALPILVGVAGPIAIATLALLALAGVPPMKAVTLPPVPGAAVWLAQTLALAWPVQALGARLVPESWCAQLRCLPIGALALFGSDLAVSVAVLAPAGGLYAVSAIAFALHRTPWFVAAWPRALASLALSWCASCLLGAVALAWRRRVPAPSRARAVAGAPVSSLARSGPGLLRAVGWAPWWRAQTQPGGRAIATGLVGVGLLGAAWTSHAWPVVPGAAWAMAASAWLVALTERAQRAQESHLMRVEPWLLALPFERRWRLQARLLLALPMLAGAVLLVGQVLITANWRPLPLAAFGLLLIVTPLVLGAVPSAQREAHVGLWAVSVGLLTAIGSELWP